MLSRPAAGVCGPCRLAKGTSVAAVPALAAPTDASSARTITAPAPALDDNGQGGNGGGFDFGAGRRHGHRHGQSGL
ncbi:hypothetical protein ACIO53_05610 [Streptomyces sp. NPDC087305]|uniref:hypothetical protein n=1 Tax=Streptomyces sp. NPDC087305 TaxID=3365781 RepID=UPI003815C1CD